MIRHPVIAVAIVVIHLPVYIIFLHGCACAQRRHHRPRLWKLVLFIREKQECI